MIGVPVVIPGKKNWPFNIKRTQATNQPSQKWRDLQGSKPIEQGQTFRDSREYPARVGLLPRGSDSALTRSPEDE